MLVVVVGAAVVGAARVGAARRPARQSAASARAAAALARGSAVSRTPMAAGMKAAVVTGCVTRQSASMAAFTASAWPSTFTLRQIFRTVPVPSIRKVLRSMPIDLRPYMFFSTQTP